mgnify:CR=1 FL=1
MTPRPVVRGQRQRESKVVHHTHPHSGPGRGETSVPPSCRTIRAAPCCSRNVGKPLNPPLDRGRGEPPTPKNPPFNPHAPDQCVVPTLSVSGRPSWWCFTHYLHGQRVDKGAYLRRKIPPPYHERTSWVKRGSLGRKLAAIPLPQSAEHPPLLGRVPPGVPLE